MAGYLNARPSCLRPDGWLRTGDLARIDADGNLFIVDRIKDLIKVNAFQVAPAELEALLVTHPHVADAAVVGRPDARTGEVPVAFVVPRGPLDPDALMRLGRRARRALQAPRGGRARRRDPAHAVGQDPPPRARRTASAAGASSSSRERAGVEQEAVVARSGRCSGGSPARSAAASDGVGEGDDRAGELEQRQRAAADAGDAVDHRGALDRARRARCARRAERLGRRVQHRQDRDLARARRGGGAASPPARRARACRSAGRGPAGAAGGLDRVGAADEQPRLRPAEQLVAREADERGAGARPSGAPAARRAARRARPSRRRRSPARRARTAPRSARPRRTRAGGSSTGARAGPRPCPAPSAR